jgi:hypothetical protein
VKRTFKSVVQEVLEQHRNETPERQAEFVTRAVAAGLLTDGIHNLRLDKRTGSWGR